MCFYEFCNLGGNLLKRFIIIIVCLTFLIVGCSIKENKLVILENSNKNNNKPENIENWQFETASQKNIIEKNRELLQKIDQSFLPIIVSPDYSTVFVIKNYLDSKSDEINSRYY